MQLSNGFRRCRHVLASFGSSAALALLVSGAILNLSATSFAAPASCGTSVQCIITIGDNAIAARMTVLNTLKSKVDRQFAAGHISSASQSALDGDISANEGGLTTLKATLDAETSAAAARTDVHNIYYQFRIYAVVLPRDYHELWLDILAQVDGKLSAAQPKIQAAITAIQGLPDKDNDKEKINSAFADFSNQLSTAGGQIQAAQGQIPLLTPTSFDTTPSVYHGNFTDYVNDIHGAHNDIRAAARDLHIIAQALKDLVGDLGGAHASPVPTATSSGT